MPTFVDLFAGCGGFSVGLRAAGWTSIAEVEIDNWACETLRANFPESRVLEADIRTIADEDILALGSVDLIVGGPPCQGFSVAGSTQFGVDDPRNELFRWFLHWVQLLQPRVAMIENVPAILGRSTIDGTVVNAVRETLAPFGYRVDAKVLNSADYGVPQSRRRAFIVMTRGKGDFKFPSATNGNASVQTDLFDHLRPYTTVGQALSDLPEIDAGEGSDEPVPYPVPAQNDYQRVCRGQQRAVANHVAMKHTARLVERFRMIAPGQSLKDVPQSHGQIANRTGEKVDKPFKYNNYRLASEKPSLAIPASFQSLFLHPTRHRNLTAREAARLMGFSDDFIFRGKRTTMSWEKNLSQYNQIGNAVCPPVARALGQEVLKYLMNFQEDESFAQRDQIIIDKNRLVSVSIIPQFRSKLPKEIVSDLRSACADIGEFEQTFRHKGLEIPTVALALAVIVAEAECCSICSPDLAPWAHHDGKMCFLISKDGNDSLLENEQDHGLDYHLRSVLNVNKEIGHLVGERLSESGIVELITLPNPRTGRSVRGMQVLKHNWISQDLADRVLHALHICTGQSLDSRVMANA